ncbi:hypothetical protein CEXT_354461 [Caerostris extrusa]|uniref:Uncharacterized protein n=1 Tax=Caerostris extrusa TaxID=172846 RepID=A0AAV4XDA6_CAEEX|nr:hypothetical protein CEXT_354461 [Caerostris extrusa]
MEPKALNVHSFRRHHGNTSTLHQSDVDQTRSKKRIARRMSPEELKSQVVKSRSSSSFVSIAVMCQEISSCVALRHRLLETVMNYKYTQIESAVSCHVMSRVSVNMMNLWSESSVEFEEEMTGILTTGVWCDISVW